MRFLLRSDPFVDALKLLMNALDLAPRGFALLAVQIRYRCSRQPSMRAVHNGGHHFQIA